MKPLFSFLIAACAALCLASCQKDNAIEADAAQVVTAISSPAEGEVFHTGDTVHIRATVSYPSELHGYELTVADSAGNELFAMDEHVHSDHFAIDTAWVPALAAPTALRLKLTTEIDHDGHEASKEVSFRLEP